MRNSCIYIKTISCGKTKYGKFTRCHASYCGLSLIFHLCQVHMMPCFVIVAFRWSFIYVKFTRFCFDLILYVPSTIFQLYRDGLPGLNQYWARINVSYSRTTTQWRRWGSNPRPFGLESSTLPLSHCAPQILIVAFLWSFIYVKFTRCCTLLL